MWYNNVITGLEVEIMITLKAIAENLGVSVSTVSRVVTDKDKVDPDTRKRIKEALELYNYVPNEMARGLRGKNSKSIGIIVPTLTSNYYTRVIAGVQKVTRENAYSVVISNSEFEEDNEKSAAQLISTKQMSGLICASVIRDNLAFYKEISRTTKVVFFDSDTENNALFGHIGFDAYENAKKLANYVISLGHKNLLILNHSGNSERLAGFLSCAKSNCVVTSVYSNLLINDGYDIAKKVLSLKNRPTAVLSTNDSLAFAAIRAVYDLGLNVPGDISVAGFDICDETGIMSPKITSILQPAGKIGEIAANMLIKSSLSHINVDAELIIGNSCRRI